MQCVVPFCENISKITPSQATGITFHRFPTEEGRRAAWLKALSIPNAHLSDSAVVCSQHFLNEDVYVTESGTREICPEAIPSTVLVCMTCLDTDSELLLMSKHKLQEVYEQLTGHPCGLGNLQQTLCVQCAQTLRDFSRFRERSLRARSLMMGLLQTYGLVTMRHLELIKHERELKSKHVTSPLEADDCDSHMEHDADNQTALEEDDNIEVKIEQDSTSVEEEIGSFVPEDSLLDPLKCKDDEDGLVGLPSRRATYYNEHKARATEEADTTLRRERARATDSDDDTRTNIRNCVVVLYDIYKRPKFVSKRNESLMQTRQADSSCDSLNTDTARKDAQYRAASERELAGAHDEPAAAALSDVEPYTYEDTSRTQTQKNLFTCDVCQLMFTGRNTFVRHVKIHNKDHICKYCDYRSAYKHHLEVHMRIHTREKPFSCKFCDYKGAYRSTLASHMRTHTGEKPYACKYCEYRCAERSYLVIHTRKHTGEKPYACKYCEYRCADRSSLVTHTRTHTGEKPFSCKFCKYKCADSSSLGTHTRTHTGEKPFSCELCEYKSASSSSLNSHMRRKHTTRS